MSNDIGGGMYVRQMREHGKYYSADDIEVHIWTDRTSAYSPSLVIPNLLEVKHLRDYLDWVIKQHPKYFKERK